MSLLMERLYSNYIEDLYYDFYTCNDYEFDQKLYSGYYDDLLLDLEQREFGAKERKTKRAAGDEIKHLVESQNKAKKKILKAVDAAKLLQNIGKQKSPQKRYRKPKANKNSNWTGAISGNGGVKANTEFDKKVIEKAIEENNIAADSVKDAVKDGLTVENPVPKSEIVQEVVEDVKPSNFHTPTGSSQSGYESTVKKAKENWFKKNKKALAIGGSIAAVGGGLGYGIYRHNKDK